MSFIGSLFKWHGLDKGRKAPCLILGRKPKLTSHQHREAIARRRSPAHRQSRAGRVILSVLPEKLAYESARPNEEASPRHLVPALDGGLPGDWRRRLALSPDASCSRSLVKTGGGDHAHRREIFLEVAGRDSRRPTVILTAGRFARLSNKLAIFSSYSPHQAENSPLK
jgi:hypothetical protein